RRLRLGGGGGVARRGVVVGQPAAAGGAGGRGGGVEQVRPAHAREGDLRPRVRVVAGDVVAAGGARPFRGETHRDPRRDAERARHHRVRAGELHAEAALVGEELQDGGAVVDAADGGVVDEAAVAEVVAQRRRLAVGGGGVGGDVVGDGRDLRDLRRA